MERSISKKVRLTQRDPGGEELILPHHQGLTLLYAANGVSAGLLLRWR
jgi:hypothetical protein